MKRVYQRATQQEYREKANQELANYDFGEGIMVQSVNSWSNSANHGEFACSIWLRQANADTSDLAYFTVEFDRHAEVRAVKCVSHGEPIGRWQYYYV